MTALLFDRPAPASAALVFGDEAAVTAVNITLSGAFPALAASVTLIPPAFAVVSGAFPPSGLAVALKTVAKLGMVGAFAAPQMTAAALYVTNTQRPTVAQVAHPAQVAQATEGGITHAQQHAQRTSTGYATHFAEAAPTPITATAAYAQAVPTPTRITSMPTEARPLDAVHTQGRLSDADPAARAAWISSMTEGQRGPGPRTQGRMQDGHRDRRPSARTHWHDARPRSLPYQGHAGPATPLRSGRRGGLFQEAWPPRPGISPIYVPPGPVPVMCYTPNGHLLFATAAPGTPYLLFACDTGSGEGGGGTTPPVVDPVYFSILPARFYMTTHSLIAHRLPDLTPIPLFDATVAADAGSYCWTLSASGPASLFELLAPADGLPVQLRVTLDGIVFVFAVDALSRTHKFGQTGVSVSGRSVTALIGAPYLRASTYSNTEARMAQQLALDALDTGATPAPLVGLDWGLTDWLVPTGAWSHQGTPLDAVQAIVQAAGGYLQSHRSAATLLARHPYSQRAGDHPGAPWGWMTGPADVELAPDAIIMEGTQRIDGADLNAVYVSGTTQGVLAQVKRTGTAGDKLSAMVTDALITDAIAARQRGLAILGAAGLKYRVSLELPVLTGAGHPGVLDVGQLVQVNTTTPWRARVRSVSAAYRGNSLRQTVALERHLEIA